jgi:hypothetical protein
MAPLGPPNEWVDLGADPLANAPEHTNGVPAYQAKNDEPLVCLNSPHLK